MSGSASPPVAPSKADAFVVSCIDPRTTGDTGDLLAALGRSDRYSEMRIAGAALAAVNPQLPGWSQALWDNLAASRQLHGIRKVTFVNHRDCGAMHQWAGRRLADDPADEARVHAEVLRRAAAAVRERHPDLLIELKMLNLDGSAEVVPCEVCVPRGFRAEAVGPAAQIIAAAADGPGMRIVPNGAPDGAWGEVARDGAADARGFADLVRVRTSGGAVLSPEAELALLSDGITRHGLTAQEARAISAAALAELRPGRGAAARDTLEFLRTRVGGDGQIGPRDVAEAGRLYRRLVGTGVTRTQGERLAASLAEQNGLQPRPKGVWPLRTTRWFRALLQAPGGGAEARHAVA